MILIGLGANLPSPKYGSPIETLDACLKRLSETGLTVVKASRWFKSAPVPMSDQPWYINGVAVIETALCPREVLEQLLKVENEFGRVRLEANAPRVLDLDLIAYYDEVIEDAGKIEDKPFCIPHPRMHERAFVLLPIQDISQDWTHPKKQVSLQELITQLPKDQIIEAIEQD
ncbi:7, 8-dihydro-6-hydroxymethylpterin-pyrophosphokinase [Candidatus Terasakiella magnetica]|uniref:2-amino-4-hydroxy-6-hydroxymethyldihydropteridine pyrophosphokinase n=1 Tax=Candidatus Terasakiella magnetica TaxID=1867952 RepID=A0A1C3RCX8_9PROT|nr:2-amino-4-hydroxy-6-hydroxymethyldihydropteridine diphosphokinase [Candidatus Terasakiella magnetica]SCA55088.1 7, 8-dihydro-6-hydroxymethylpterin-pyrophosphokinase [Candidatus Terasakiella magnetica]